MLRLQSFSGIGAETRRRYYAFVLRTPLRQVLTNADPTMLGLGACCLIFAGGFFFSAFGRDRARFRSSLILGTMITSLEPLRGVLQSKVRGQVGACFLAMAGILIGAAVTLDVELPKLMLPGGAIGLVVLSAVLLFLQGKYTENAMRRYLQAHLREFHFSFEDNLALTREIGELFGIPGATEDTVESYVRRLRDRLGLKEAPSKLFGRRAPHFPA
ncbi:MAG: hypothetical protein QM477_03410 [Planctomycetota bacterium]